MGRGFESRRDHKRKPAVFQAFRTHFYLPVLLLQLPQKGIYHDKYVLLFTICLQNMNFEPCIRYFDNLGLAKVYVRITHKRKIGYIKTRFIAKL